MPLGYVWINDLDESHISCGGGGYLVQISCSLPRSASFDTEAWLRIYASYLRFVSELEIVLLEQVFVHF